MGTEPKGDAGGSWAGRLAGALAKIQRAVALSRARRALGKIRRDARSLGTNRLSPEEVAAEIRAARTEHRARLARERGSS
jgi:hypothetical protein